MGGGACLEKLKILYTVMLLIHALMNSSGCVECTSSCIYSEIVFTIISFFPKLIKGGGVGIKAGGGAIIRYSRVGCIIFPRLAHLCVSPSQYVSGGHCIGIWISCSG